MTASRLQRAVERYKSAITALEASAEPLSAEQIIEVLVARDAVQVAMAQKHHHNPGILITTVNELDVRLRKQAEAINRAIKLADWRNILNPPEKEWWWLLDPPVSVPWSDRYDWLWKGVSVASLTVSLSLLVDISTRFLMGGPDTLGALAVVTQSVLTLLAGGGALTKTGQEATEHIFQSLKIPKRFWDEISCSLSLLLLLSMLGFRGLLPWIAEEYKEQGLNAYNAHQLASAENHYNRAIKLNPDNLQAYYQLGKIHEDLQDFEKALENYKIVVKGGIPEAAEAADNIAKLYLQKEEYSQADKWLEIALEDQLMKSHQGKAYTINEKQYTTLQRLVYLSLQKDKYADAYRWLFLGLGGTKDDPEKQYFMLTYYGWILLKQERYSEAKRFLQEAIVLLTDKAPAYCLQAQALEGLKEQTNADAEWEQCLTYADQKDPDENTWIGLALKRLEAKGNE